MSSYLPQELADHIVGYLRKDKRSLRACTLVCRNWVHTSRSHLFHELDVFTSRWYYGLPTFLNELKNCPNVIPYVKVLKIGKHATHDIPSCGGAYQFSIDPQMVAEILSVLYSVHSLIIEDLRIYDHVPWETTVPISLSSHRSHHQLKKLSINNSLLCVEGFSSSEAQPLLSLLRVFKSIDELSVRRTSLWEVPHPLTPPSPQLCGRSLRVRSLAVEFGYSPSSTLMGTLDQVLDTSTLQYADFQCEGNQDAELIGAFLCNTPKLRRLHIDVGAIWGSDGESTYSEAYDQSVWTKLNLSSCHSLQSLAIDFSLSRSDSAHGRDLASWETVFNILSIAPSSLRSVSLLGTYFHRPYDEALLKRIDWDRLRSLLHHFPSLNKVLFDLTEWPRTHMPVSGESIARRELRPWDERGILKVPSTVRVCPYVSVPVVPTRSSRPWILFRWLAKLSHRRA